MGDAMDVARRWAGSGMAFLTGDPDIAPDFTRAPVLDAAAQTAAPFGVEAGVLIAGRAGLAGYTRAGRTSAGGGTRMIRCRDGWCAFTLARPTDVDMLGALLETDESIVDPWRMLIDVAGDRTAEGLVERGRLLGLPCSVLASHAGEAVVRQQLWPTCAPRPVGADLLVVDLSAMWAGPLCGQLLRGLGATVIKVESPDRPDGARYGNPDFFKWMNGGKLFFSSPLTDQSAALAGLLDVADVVIEASRPRALEQAGLNASTRVPRPGRVWVKITGYGSGPDTGGRVAFGDDAAVAGGLVGASPGGPVFCADAIADPLTGLEAARAVLEALSRGGGEILDIAMAGVAARYAAIPPLPPDTDLTDIAVQPPPTPQISRIARDVVDTHWITQLIDNRRGNPC